jgi:hypothetical protein
MSLRFIFWLAIALIAAAAGWRYRDTITGAALGTPAAPKKSFEFDNGTLRDIPVAVPGAPALKPPGTMRKCVRGYETTYTNFSCPAGFKERPMTAADRVNVVPSTSATRPAPTAGAEPPGISSLRDKFDISQDARLREKAMERAVDAQGR